MKILRQYRLLRLAHLALAFALLLLGWSQLAHETDLAAHQPDQGCEICLLSGHIDQGAHNANPQPTFTVTQHDAPYTTAAAPVVHTFHYTLGQRGPPCRS